MITIRREKQFAFDMLASESKEKIMIKEYTKKDGSQAYLIKVYLGIDPLTGKKRFTTRRGFRTQKEAKMAQSRLEVEAQDNKYCPEKNYTFDQIKDLWLTQYKDTVKESTYRRVIFLFKNNIGKKFGNKRIAKYNIPYCQKAVNEWKDSYATYRALKSYTTAVFDFAIKMNVLIDNPMKHVSFSTGKRTIKKAKLKFFEVDELKRFLECCKEDSFPLTYPLFRLLAFSGIRKGELLALTWDDIDLEQGMLTINKTAALNNKNQVEATTSKTKHSNRTISLDELTVQVLKKWKIKQKEYLLMYGIKTLKEDQLVFASKSNNYLAMTRPNQLLARLCDKYGFPNISIHGFRHTHCSLLFEAELSAKEVQDRLGHSDIQTTLNIYTHITKKQKDVVAEKFANYVQF